MGKKTRPRFCWDTCCFLSWLSDKHPDRRPACAAILQAAERGDVELYASTFALAESVYVSRELSAEENTHKIERFFRNRYIRLVNVDWAIASRARWLQGQVKLDPWDAVHLATAIQVDADALHTYDRAIVSCDGMVPEASLRICHPSYTYQLGFLGSGPGSEAAMESDESEDESLN